MFFCALCRSVVVSRPSGARGPTYSNSCSIFKLSTHTLMLGAVIVCATNIHIPTHRRTLTYFLHSQHLPPQPCHVAMVATMTMTMSCHVCCCAIMIVITSSTSSSSIISQQLSVFVCFVSVCLSVRSSQKLFSVSCVVPVITTRHSVIYGNTN